MSLLAKVKEDLSEWALDMKLCELNSYFETRKETVLELNFYFKIVNQ